MVADNGLSQPVTSLKGVGGKVAERLVKIGVQQVQDLLFHLPLRYQDRTRLMPLGALRLQQEVLVEGTIQLSQVKFGRRRSLLCHISDGTGSLILRFFHFSKAQQLQLEKGRKIRCFGEVRNGPSSFEMVHPEYQLIDAGKIVPVDSELTPVYPTTEGLHQLSLRKLITQALASLENGLMPELVIPEARCHNVADFSLTEALKFVHQPPPDAPVQQLIDRQHPAQKRLAYEELLAQQLTMKKLRQQTQHHRAPALNPDPAQREALLNQLPFPLTKAQQRVLTEIEADMIKPFPMQRLVQGDVGSGKTVVAALAAIDAVSAGAQAVMMAPTELLAEQHFKTFTQWLTPLGMKVGWCAGKQTAAERRQVLEQLKSGEIKVAVGTHALFQDEVVFNQLGLVIIDEQHRFGVHQRLALRDKGRDVDTMPHQLVMTATPIPRTLAMTAYADLSVSVIDELPPGRTPVTTVVVSDGRRQDVIERVHAACQQNRQVYWVCTLIEESEHLQCQAAEDTATTLQESLPDLKIGLVHGRMKSADKERVMSAFKAGELDMLVATTVIEVGVDVPNASLMVIENAERLGLAQLHQLRGRVGRGQVESHCVLMYHAPLSENGQARLKCLRESNDGFVIAQRDLEIRGPGEVLGTRQTGLPQFRVANLLEDQELLTVMEQAANKMLELAPEKAEALVTRWFAHKLDFGHV
ncbi:MAG TPA: ATP-dependent DNA helicase RecG [Methylophaga aminisulfidivorans]|uniref:ATP-dependent DNA helicase RecG n=1 Tax=Methylophaga TaxID=40222 RepID=UPI001763F430|nr:MULTISPECIES: ATP-dependent DNA helicase RecG [Methylophaga]HIC46772.1 ATP-dependent DNA helicase RecG [Methylophaga sp.]HIM39493.1 ATP-dependent DNA helicase RecG [Methylophaga aminisulfidivorans]